MTRHARGSAAVAAALAIVAIACTNGTGEGELGPPWEMDDCEIVAEETADHDGPVERRRAVLDAVNSEGLADADYRALAETCVRLQCPAPTPSPADAPAYVTAPLPIDHADLGPDAPWPCATGDIL